MLLPPSSSSAEKEEEEEVEAAGWRRVYGREVGSVAGHFFDRPRERKKGGGISGFSPTSSTHFLLCLPHSAKCLRPERWRKGDFSSYTH